MDTIKQIIEARGGIEALKAEHIRLDVPGYMPLSIELVGTGPRGLPLLSVMHWYVQEGDCMRDPDMTFEIDAEGAWLPISYQQDGLGLYQEAVFLNDDGKVLMRPKLVKDLRAFMKQWDKNLKEQGFLQGSHASEH